MTNAVGLFFTSSGPTTPGTPPTPTVSSAPTLTGLSAGDSVVTVFWSVPGSTGGSALESFTVERGTTSGGETSLHTGISPTTTNWVDSTAVNDTEYWYDVVAINGVGASAASNELSATPTNSTTVPDPPTITSIAPGDGEVSITFVAGSDGGTAITSFTLLRGTSSGTETSHITGISSGASSYTDSTSVTNDTEYWYELLAINADGPSSASNEESATPTAPPPPSGALLGFYTGSVSGVESLASSLGISPLQGYSEYTDGDSFGTIGSYGPPSLPDGCRLFLGVNMCPPDEISSVSSNLSHYETLAGNLPDDTIVRLGWEFDIGTGTGGFGHVVAKSDFIAAWQAIYTAMKGVNSTLLFDFCCNSGTSTLSELEDWYPGDAFVDMVGGDHYDQTSGGSDTFSAMEACVTLAINHDKPVSCGEFGLNGQDDVDFIDDAAQFFLDPTATSSRYGWGAYTVYYFSYFSLDFHEEGSIDSDITEFSAAFAEFATKFG